jgi:hypothetical protein
MSCRRTDRFSNAQSSAIRLVKADAGILVTDSLRSRLDSASGGKLAFGPRESL